MVKALDLRSNVCMHTCAQIPFLVVLFLESKSKQQICERFFLSMPVENIEADCVCEIVN